MLEENCAPEVCIKCGMDLQFDAPHIFRDQHFVVATCPSCGRWSVESAGFRFWTQARDEAARLNAREVPAAQAFGEGFWGMSEHCSDLSQLDRQIFEQCWDGSGNVQRPGTNVPQISKLQRVEVVARQCSCTLGQAEDLIDFFGIIDDSGRLHPEFIRWVQKRGVDKALPYFEGLAGELVSDEVHVNEKPFSLIRDLRPFGEENPWFAEDEIETEASDGDVDPESWDDIVINDIEDLEQAWQRLTKRQLQMLAADPVPAMLEHDVAAVFESYGFHTEDGKFVLDRGFGTPDLFRYARINQDDNKAEDAHLKSCTRRFQEVIRQLRSEDSLVRLKKFGQLVFAQKLTRSWVRTPAGGWSEHERQSLKQLNFWRWEYRRCKIALIHAAQAAMHKPQLRANTVWLTTNRQQAAQYPDREFRLTQSVVVDKPGTARALISRLRNLPASKIKFAAAWIINARKTGCDLKGQPLKDRPSDNEFELIREAWFTARDKAAKQQPQVPPLPPLPPPPEEPEYQAWVTSHY